MIQSFDASNPEHVKWLKKVIDAPTNDKLKVMTDNPMKKDMPPFELVQILFAISMKYTQAVFKKTAHILDD
jgi:hypothetical protein